MKNIKDYSYELPEELIAQKPSEKRDHSRLLVFNREDNSITDTVFHNILDFLEKGDLLVVNNTQVMPARLLGRKRNTGAFVEIFLLSELESGVWETLARPAKRLSAKTIVDFSDQENIVLEAEILEVHDGGKRIVRFDSDEDFESVIDRIGHVPLPPYIKRDDAKEDKDRYQTVFASKKGAVAAPTAGLHFTPGLLEIFKAKGVGIAELTLHVGIGTFRPIEVEDLNEHTMHEEYYLINQENVQKINEAKKAGNRIIAVGTTSMRTLETIGYPLSAQNGFTDIFIKPPYDFQVVDCLITNFHLPQSSLLVLVSAFADRERILGVYDHAIKGKYRFFSYGDAMLIL